MKSNKGYTAFCEYINNKTIALVGLGISNLPLVSFLYECGAKKVNVRDLKKSSDSSEVLKATANGAEVYLGGAYLDNLNEDIIIRTPGIRPDIPAFLEAERLGSRITCETELFLEYVPCTSIVVTGSDGKTTTTTLISKILESSGWRVFLGGNIGKSMLPQIKEITGEKCISVSELSSFQLMNCHFSPNVAVITNLSENHLDWHKDMAEYLEAKKNILAHQNSMDKAVLNFDNLHTAACDTNGEKVYFSYQVPEKLMKESAFVFLRNNAIFLKNEKKEEQILSVDSIILPGKHNVENYMAAIAATSEFATKNAVKEVAETFGGVEHRIERIRELNGVVYYNSSIDSSPSRSTAALRAFQEKVIMIAGGYDKNLDYTALGDEICTHVKTLILCGATTEKIKSAVINSSMYKENMPQILLCPDFYQTALLAQKNATQGDVVILSPASASFDLFKNFEERGKLFKKIVMELQ